MTDASGNVAESYRYTSYGSPTIFDSSGSQVSESKVQQPFLFTGRRWDFEEGSGLYYYRHRYYDPEAGRFISRDPLGSWGDASQRGNAQNYCGNNPVNFVDPLGMDPRGSRPSKFKSLDEALKESGWKPSDPVQDAKNAVKEVTREMHLDPVESARALKKLLEKLAADPDYEDHWPEIANAWQEARGRLQRAEGKHRPARHEEGGLIDITVPLIALPILAATLGPLAPEAAEAGGAGAGAGAGAGEGAGAATGASAASTAFTGSLEGTTYVADIGEMGIMSGMSDVLSAAKAAARAAKAEELVVNTGAVINDRLLAMLVRRYGAEVVRDSCGNVVNVIIRMAL